MNHSMTRTVTQVDGRPAALMAAYMAECTPEGRYGMQIARLHDAYGKELGMLFYSIAEEDLNSPRIIFVEPHHVETASGRSNFEVEELAAARLHDIVVQRVGANQWRMTYLCWGVKPADRAQLRLWREVDDQLRALVKRKTGVRALEEWKGCRDHLQRLAEPLVSAEDDNNHCVAQERHNRSDDALDT